MAKLIYHPPKYTQKIKKKWQTDKKKRQIMYAYDTESRIKPYITPPPPKKIYIIWQKKNIKEPDKL